MTDEEKREKYKNIAYRLKVINNKVKDLDSSILGLKNTIKKNIVINDDGLNEDSLNEINEMLDSVSYNIKRVIIPSLNNKIYD